MEAPELENALPSVQRLRVGPLSVGATQRLVQARLGTTFARPTLLRVHETSGGNPFYALELAAHGAAGDPLPVLETLEGLVCARLEGLPDATREAIVLAAALGRASPALLAAAGVSADALDAARDAPRHRGRRRDQLHAPVARVGALAGAFGRRTPAVTPPRDRP